MKGFFTLFAFNYRNFMKMRTLVGLTVALMISLGGFLYYVGLRTSNGPTDLYVQNNSNITPSTWQVIVAKMCSDDVCKVKELTNEEIDYPRVVLQQQGDVYEVEFRYRNDGNEKAEIEGAVVTAVSDGVRTQPVMSNIMAKRSYESDDAEKVRMISLIIMWVTYLLILICGASITQSISSEKVNRIMDVLVYKVSPATIIFSKICALLTVVGQLLLILILEVFIFQALGILQADFLSQLLVDLNIGYNEGLLIVLCAFLGCFLYTLLFAIPGIFVTSEEQRQFAAFPVTLTLISAFVFTYIALALMDQPLLKYATYVPLTAPLTMPAVLILGGYQYTDLIIPFLLVVLFLASVTIVINKVVLPRKLN